MSPTRDRLAAGLRLAPLAARMTFYGVVFFALALVALPWLAFRIDVAAPAWRIEIGWLRATGPLLFLGSLAAYLASAYRLTSRGRGAYVEFDPPRQLVTTGPYAWVRNPVAACVLGMVLGEAITFSSTGILLLFLFGLLFVHVQVRWIEEPLLRRRFGPAYEEYAARVPRWLPRRPRDGGR